MGIVFLTLVIFTVPFKQTGFIECSVIKPVSKCTCLGNVVKLISPNFSWQYLIHYLIWNVRFVKMLCRSSVNTAYSHWWAITIIDWKWKCQFCPYDTCRLQSDLCFLIVWKGLRYTHMKFSLFLVFSLLGMAQLPLMLNKVVSSCWF